MPFEIPENWVWTILGNIGEIITGTTPPKDNKEYYGGNIPFYKPTDLDGGIMTNYALDTLTDVGYEQCRKLPSESVLVTCIGATIGKVGVIRVAGACNQQINAIIPSTIVDYRYLYYALTSDFLQREILEHSSSTTLPIINKGKFSELPFPLPSLGEQNRIVIEVEKWFDFIADIEGRKVELEAYIRQAKSKILDLAISGKLVPQDPNDEPAIELLKRINPDFHPCDNSHYENLPQGWVKAGFKDIYQTISSRDYQIQQRDIINEGLYPVVSQSSNYIEGYYNDKEKLLDVSAPVLIFGDHTRVVKYIDFPFVIGADGVKVIKPLINDKFAYYLLLYTSQHIDNKGYSRHFQFIAKANYCIPPLREQTHIAISLETLLETINTITAEL